MRPLQKNCVDTKKILVIRACCNWPIAYTLFKILNYFCFSVLFFLICQVDVEMFSPLLRLYFSCSEEGKQTRFFPPKPSALIRSSYEMEIKKYLGKRAILDIEVSVNKFLIDKQKMILHSISTVCRRCKPLFTLYLHVIIKYTFENNV